MQNPVFAIRAAVLAVFVMLAGGPVASLYGAVSDLSVATKDTALVIESRRL